jgi:NAD/NADP transhydrogenase alpha subunit
MTLTVAVPRESLAGERRVAIAPDAVGRLQKLGLEVQVEAGAGGGAYFDDAAYTKAGAKIEPDAAALWQRADLVVKVQPPTAVEAAGLKSGAVLVSFLVPGECGALLKSCTERKVTSFSLNLLPRTTRAQNMDALSSMSTIAGYKAVLLAAEALPKFLPMLVTAAGTIVPAKALILGVGVAGLQAIARAACFLTGCTRTPRRWRRSLPVRSTGAWRTVSPSSHVPAGARPLSSGRCAAPPANGARTSMAAGRPSRPPCLPNFPAAYGARR